MEAGSFPTRSSEGSSGPWLAVQPLHRPQGHDARDRGRLHAVPRRADARDIPLAVRLKVRLPRHRGKEGALRRRGARAIRGGPAERSDAVRAAADNAGLRAGNGKLFAGALSMFLFSLGTVPLLLGFGAISAFLSAKFNRRMLKASGVLVMALGLVMFTRGVSLFGVALPGVAPAQASRLRWRRSSADYQEVGRRSSPVTIIPSSCRREFPSAGS